LDVGHLVVVLVWLGWWLVLHWVEMALLVLLVWHCLLVLLVLRYLLVLLVWCCLLELVVGCLLLLLLVGHWLVVWLGRWGVHLALLWPVGQGLRLVELGLRCLRVGRGRVLELLLAAVWVRLAWILAWDGGLLVLGLVLAHLSVVGGFEVWSLCRRDFVGLVWVVRVLGFGLFGLSGLPGFAAVLGWRSIGLGLGSGASGLVVVLGGRTGSRSVASECSR
jgi:hypothetical protein